MDDAAVQSLQTAIVWSTFLLAGALGFIMSRTHYCSMGAIADIVNLGDWTRMRMWMGAIGVAILGTQSLAGFGLIDLNNTLYAGTQLNTASLLLGGVVFGIGMVLASGCGSKTLIRIGGGSLKSLIVFFVIGLSAYMTIRGIFAPARVYGLDTIGVVTLESGQDLPHLLAGDDVSFGVRLALATTVGGALLLFAFAGKDFRAIKPIVGSFGVGLAVVALWFVSANMGFVAEHPETLEAAYLATNSGQAESFSFVSPVAHTVELLLLWTDASRIVSIGIAAVLGVIAGSFVDALLTRNFRIEAFAGPEDIANHLLGATLMGFGGITAHGCTIGQGLSGLSTLASGSLLAWIGIVLGTVIALRYQIWRVERMV